jgi:ribosomal protein L3
MVKGAVPGPAGGDVCIRPAVKGGDHVAAAGGESE